MKGWVYVISNAAMPGLVKVGFSTKDPELRASELGNTGVAHPYVVEYDVLLEHPRRVERSVHELLSGCHEGREWFRCSPDYAVSVIQQVVGDGAIAESFKSVDRENAKRLLREREETQSKLEQARKKREEDALIRQTAEAQLRQQYESELRAAFPERSVGLYIAGAFLLSLSAIAAIEPDLSVGHLLGASLLVGAVGGVAAKSWHRERQKSSERCRSMREGLEQNIAAINKVVVPCPACAKGLRVPAGKVLQVTCARCGKVFEQET